MKNDTIEIAGSVCFWNISAETNQTKLAQMLDAIDQENCIPHARTAFAAAKQACLKHYRGEGYRVEKLKDGNGITVERITRGELENTYTQIAYMIVDDEKNIVEKCRVFDTQESNQAAVENALIDSFEVELRLCSANAVGMALARAVEAHDGYRLRPTGGVYFLPTFKEESFQKVAEIFEACAVGGQTMVHRLSVAKGDATIRAVHSTIRERISERIAEMRDELAAGLKKNGRKNRKEEVQQLIEQTSRYEALLDESLAEVRADLENVKVQLAMETVATAGNLFASLEMADAA
jgi:hypothetical protein